MKDNTRDPLMMIILAWLAGISVGMGVGQSRLAVLEYQMGVARPRYSSEKTAPKTPTVWAYPSLLPAEAFSLPSEAIK